MPPRTPPRIGPRGVFLEEDSVAVAVDEEEVDVEVSVAAVSDEKRL